MYYVIFNVIKVSLWNILSIAYYLKIFSRWKNYFYWKYSNKYDYWIFHSDFMDPDARYFILTYKFNDTNYNSWNPINYPDSYGKRYLLWCLLRWALDRLINGRYRYSIWLFLKWFCSKLAILWNGYDSK